VFPGRSSHPLPACFLSLCRYALNSIAGGAFQQLQHVLVGVAGAG